MLPDFIIQNNEGYKLPYPAERWEEGTLLGNGKQGAIFMGEAQRETIVLTHEKLFAPIHERIEPIPMAEQLPQIRRLLDEKKYREASEWIMEMYCRKEGSDKKLWTNPFFPAAELTIETGDCGLYQNYSRSLSFQTGEAKVEFVSDKQAYQRKAFYSREADALVIEISSSQKADYRVQLNQRPYCKDGSELIHELFPNAEGIYFFQPQIGSDEEKVWYLCGYHERKNGYGVIGSVMNTDGTIVNTRESIQINGAKNVHLFVRVFLIEDMKNAVYILKQNAENLKNQWESMEADKNVYEHFMEKHLTSYMERYNRIRLQLPENKHLGTIFGAGRYAILSASGEMPPNLQGVWTGTYEVPWSSDYTQNGNLQTAILGLLSCGDFECMQSYFRYQESLLEDYRENSRILYGCRGIHIPSRTSDSGLDIHFDVTWPMLFWTAGAAWVAHFYYDYWLYTGDAEFFNQRALPFMKEAALFYEDFLIEDENGCWKFTPSYSPENTPVNSENAACINAAMDISVAKELFINLITGCSTLGIEEKSIIHWKKILQKMPPYVINKEGALQEWAVENLTDMYDHRHSSHLYMLYYDLPWYENQDILDACKKAYKLKMKYKKKEKGSMAFGLVQAGMAAAHLKDSAMTERMILSMAENNYFRTYASSHDYDPSTFNTDISGGMPALMLETIAQCSPIVNQNYQITEYKIKLLPALPKSMYTGSVQGMHLRGGFVLDMSWKDGKIISYEIHNPNKEVYRIEKY